MRYLACFAFLLCTGVLCGQSGHAPAPKFKFSELSRADKQRLDQQRAVIATAIHQRCGTRGLTRTKRDLPILERLLGDKVFAKSQTYELQSLGVAFGDVLTRELPLRWVMIADEYGTDPTLRFKNTSVNINALTMISQRVERDEAVNLRGLLEKTRQELSKLEKQSP